MIQIKKGSIFDSKCDLIIIPCNDLGGVSFSIQNELMVNDLPYFGKKIPKGGVAFIENTGTFANASVIGYAASVDATQQKSNEYILIQIMHKIRAYCHEQEISKINTPLLGTGVGGLSIKTSFEIVKSEFERDSNILLCIYVLSNDNYSVLSNETSMVINDTIRNPRVFISYTGTDIKNRNWVKDFACRLRQNGVDARVDIFHLKPGQDLPQ